MPYRIRLRETPTGRFVGEVLHDESCIAETGHCHYELSARKRAQAIINRLPQER